MKIFEIVKINGIPRCLKIVKFYVRIIICFYFKIKCLSVKLNMALLADKHLAFQQYSGEFLLCKRTGYNRHVQD